MTGCQQLSELRARPGQSLEEHVTGVARNARELVADAGETPAGEPWIDLLQTLAWTHDFGKLTTYFQTYLETNDRSTAPRPELTYHGLLGGLVTANALHAQGFAKETIAAGTYAVLKHHGALQNIPTDFKNYHQRKEAVDTRFENARTQLENIDEHAGDAAEYLLAEATDGEYTWAEMDGDGVAFARKIIAAVCEETRHRDFYGFELRTWSSLVTADKLDASWANSDGEPPLTTFRPAVSKLTSEVQSVSNIPLPDGSTATDYLEDPTRTLPSGEATVEQRLTALRTKANAEATRNLQRYHAEGDRVFELTLPTGFGKTYSGLRAGLSLAESRDSRVIYALPYTSIIEQVDSEIRSIFDVKPTDPEYTKHHHLADTRTLPGESELLADDASSGAETLHAESWRSGLVLTTFTQLLESAAGPGNVQSTKLPALQDAVIILDEPQALSLSWWNLLGRLTDYLTTEYDASVVLMTATQPRILNHMDSAATPTPLVESTAQCIDLLRASPRVEFAIHESLSEHLHGGQKPLSLENAAGELTDSTAGTTNTLAVVNTVGSAVSLTKKLNQRGTLALGEELLTAYRDNDDGFDAEAYLQRLHAQHPEPNRLIVTLTTRLRPVDRSALLEALTRILDPDTSTPFDSIPTITVSTQLIEAGIDVSFDQLYRDYAPIPAFVQAAGRCNREFGGDVATVTLWRLDSPPDSSYVPSDLIYGDRSLLRPTKAALTALLMESDNHQISEAALVGDGVDHYYATLHEQRKTNSQSDTLVSAFNNALGEQLRNASVVESDYPTQETLVLVSQDDIHQYEQYHQHRDEKRWQSAKQSFQDLKPLLVSVPVEEGASTDEIATIRTGEQGRYEVATGRGAVIESLWGDSAI